MVAIEGYRKDTVAYHLHLLLDAHYFVAGKKRVEDRSVVADRLTMNGLGYLEHVRDPEIWNEVRSASDRIGVRSLHVLDRLAHHFVSLRIDRVTRTEQGSFSIL